MYILATFWERSVAHQYMSWLVVAEKFRKCYISILECDWQVHLTGISALKGIVAITLPFCSDSFVHWWDTYYLDVNVVKEEACAEGIVQREVPNVEGARRRGCLLLNNAQGTGPLPA